MAIVNAGACMAILWSLLAGGTATETAGPGKPRPCRPCHASQYASWRGSAHAGSVEAEPFSSMFRGLAATDQERSRLCLRCHAPLEGKEAKEAKVAKERSGEGVGCDVCHGASSVVLSGAGDRLSFGRQGGNLEQDHDSEASYLHRTGRL